MATSTTKRITPGYPQAEAIRSWINRKLRYGMSNVSTSAIDTAKKRAGVCRDFSHPGIALCRALRMDIFICSIRWIRMHGSKRFLGARWYTFDATQKQPRGNRIVISYGRDAADVAEMSEYGPVKTKQMSILVKSADA